MFNNLSFWILLASVLLACGNSSKQTNAQGDFNVSFEESDKEVVCFLYHRFGNNKYPSTNISLADFKAHLRYLNEHDFTVMTMEEAIDYMSSDEPDKKVAVLTIDDAFESFYDHALPLLKQYDFPATLYINTETVGGNTYMNWDEIQKAQQAGIEIGNHTHTHAYFLNKPTPERYNIFENEIQQTQSIIKDKLGVTPVTFAYPYGEFDLRMKEIVKKAGFKAGAAQNSGVIYAGSDRFALPRFPMASNYADPEKFASKAEMHPLRIEEVQPESFILSASANPPRLNVSFDKQHLNISGLQCFVQGGACDVDQEEVNQKVMLTLQARAPLETRRTLYTITVPDQNGEWHWFSHLWINTDKK